MSLTASRRRWLPIFIATVLAPRLSRISCTTPSGSLISGSSGRPYSTSATVRATATRSDSQESRKFAIDGT